MPAGKAATALSGGVDVGGFGVVVEVDAVDGGDEFEAMLDGVEGFDGGADDARTVHRRGARRRRRRGRFRRCAAPLSGIPVRGRSSRWARLWRRGKTIDAVFDPGALSTGCSRENQ